MHATATAGAHHQVACHAVPAPLQEVTPNMLRLLQRSPWWQRYKAMDAPQDAGETQQYQRCCSSPCNCLWVMAAVLCGMLPS